MECIAERYDGSLESEVAKRMIPMVLKKERVIKMVCVAKMGWDVAGIKCLWGLVINKWRKNINWILFVEIQTKTVTNQTSENKKII